MKSQQRQQQISRTRTSRSHSTVSAQRNGGWENKTADFRQKFPGSTGMTQCQKTDRDPLPSPFQHPTQVNITLYSQFKRYILTGRIIILQIPDFQKDRN